MERAESGMGGGNAVAAHALGWLVAGNLVGVWLAVLLLRPDWGVIAGNMTYGRWVPVHLNVQLYGWCSLPLVGWLFSVFQADASRAGKRYANAAVWAWSAALACGCVAWLRGETSGKIFLDWTGGALVSFVVALGLLWLALAAVWVEMRNHWTLVKRGWTGLGLVALACVLPAMWHAASPAVYPPFDRTTGGPTGASLLGSTLGIVMVLLLVPMGLHRVNGTRRNGWLWWLWSAELVIFGVLEWRGGTHHDWWQIGGLALLGPWLWLVPYAWNGYDWPASTKGWRLWVYLWLGVLIVSGWIDYLPGVLDRIKFTNGLVAHGHLAMAGFVSAMGMVLLGCVSGAAARLRGGVKSWNVAVAGYVISMAVCGWCEGGGAAWMSERPAWRIGLMHIRLVCGVVMLAVSVMWWWQTLGGRGWKIMTMRISKQVIGWWNLAVGSMDAATGILLVFVPGFTLRLMGLRAPGAEGSAYLSWVGVFVAAVGCSYFLAAGVPRTPADFGKWQTVWKITALARSLVGGFVIWKIVAGDMEIGWITVALTDWVVAAVQWFGLRRGWLDEGREP
jgi:cytochrome c oxidase cbb3-type subunit 1